MTKIAKYDLAFIQKLEKILAKNSHWHIFKEEAPVVSVVLSVGH